MEDYTLPFVIYLCVLTMFLGGAVKKILASQLSAASTFMAWLGATVLVERLYALCLPAALLLAVIWLGFWIHRNLRAKPEQLLSPQGKAVFITGCDSGFGKATAKHLDSLGFEVFATVLNLNSEGSRELTRSCSSRLTLLQVDITQPQQVQQALADTQNKLGLRGLWGLVNNAGVCVNFGDSELSLMSNFRGCMEVNFFGTLMVTQSFLPLLRRAKGRIVTISSPAGDLPFPCLSAYGSSKAALNLFMNTLRHELAQWGVHVSTVLPAAFKTGQSSNQAYWDQQYKNLLQSLPPSLLEEYGEDYLTETKELFQSHSRTANPDLSPVVNTITEALLTPRPHPRYYAGPGVGLMYFIHSYLPFSVCNKFLQKLFVQKKVMPRALRGRAPGFQLGLDIRNDDNNNDEKFVK